MGALSTSRVMPSWMVAAQRSCTNRQSPHGRTGGSAPSTGAEEHRSGVLVTVESRNAVWPSHPIDVIDSTPGDNKGLTAKLDHDREVVLPSCNLPAIRLSASDTSGHRRSHATRPLPLTASHASPADSPVRQPAREPGRDHPQLADERRGDHVREGLMAPVIETCLSLPPPRRSARSWSASTGSEEDQASPR